MCPHTEHTFASSLSLSLYLLLSSVYPLPRFELEYGWLMVFRGPEKSRDIARGIRTRLRSRGLSFVDKRRGVNFVYNLVGEHTRENIAPMLRGTGETTRRSLEEILSSDLAFRCTRCSPYLSRNERNLLFSPRDIERIYIYI